FKTYDLKHNLLEKNSEVELHLTELIKRNKTIGKIYIIAFHSSLEKVTNVKKEDEEKEQKIKKYVQTSEIDKIFSKALVS
ncbi:MAG: hypothetical protein V1911_00415, partial [Candidatus Micrarchaeota archaeon]